MMNMEQVIVKSEGESSGELLVFYVNENGSHEEGVITAIQNIDPSELEQLQHENYIIEAIDETSDDAVGMPSADQQNVSRDRWQDEETKRLLIFYIDNKETFLNGITKKKHLWTVACKTMLTAKNPTSCEMKLRNLKRTYSVLRVDQTKGKGMFVWPYYELCHQAFQDDSYVNMLISDATKGEGASSKFVPESKQEDNSILVVKKVNVNRSADEKVEQMLNLYIKHKKSNKEYWQKHLWETIAMELGEDGDYWHKRFLNFKQHYIRMLDKRRESGSETINWPYMKMFDEIYGNDKDFMKKYGNPHPIEPVTILNSTTIQPGTYLEWDETEKTVLVKYCFDSFDEFHDPTIPKSFLWNEVGRLLDKTPETCKKKVEALKHLHLDQYIAGNYDMRNRKPISILFDNIICKETEILISQPRKIAKPIIWDTEKDDTLIQLCYVNLEMFKDPICHFVCLAAAARKLDQSVQTCYSHWRELTAVYKSILDEKKDEPELEIDWRYIESFDRIFDYGMDTKLLEGYQKPVQSLATNAKIAVKKININLEDEFSETEDYEEYDGRGFVKRSRGTGDSKQFKILEYFQKNKDRFSTTQRKKQALWEVLAKQIGITSEQCAHRFRNLKQVYTAYIQREINKPEMPILWPYYNLCKKVFGYRAIKNKLKNGKVESDDSEDWTPKQIKQVISHFAQNFSEIDQNTDDKTRWSTLAREIDRSEAACRDKFLELRKSYRKIKTMMDRNPNCKVNWKYFKLFDQIYTGTSVEDMDVDSCEEKVEPLANIKSEVEDDDDYQCIIVVPEGEELTDISHAQIVLKSAPEEPTPIPTATHPFVWTVRNKKLLLKTYLEYIKSQHGKIINTKDMWVEISKVVKANPFSCKKQYTKLKKEYKQKLNDKAYLKNPYYTFFTKIMDCKPKFFQPKLTIEDIDLSERKTYKDILMPLWKVDKALQYYLEHLKAFINPAYETKYAWEALSKHVSVPIFKIFNKVNYLKQNYNIETGEVAGKRVDFGGLLNKIFEKEFAFRISMASEIKPMIVDVQALFKQDPGLQEPEPDHQNSNIQYAGLEDPDLKDQTLQYPDLQDKGLQDPYLQDQSLQDQSLQDQALQDQALQDQALQDQALQDQALQDQALQDHALQDQALQNQALQDHALQDQALQDQALEDQALQDKALQDKVPQDQALEDQALQDQAIQDPDLQDQDLQGSGLQDSGLKNPGQQDPDLQGPDIWEDNETEQLLCWYLENLDKFKNPQNVPSDLWIEASNVLKKTPLACSKKMSEIRTQYSSMVKETPEELDGWRFYELCQKIYGTGKKSTSVSSD